MSFFGIPIRNGLSLGLGTVASLTNGPGFLPSELYYDGTVQGAWYDPSDLTTLFQDSAGTTPVTAVEQAVGLMLDKSKGLVLGPELVTNGTFDSGTTTGWTSSGGATLTVSSGRLRVTGTGANQGAFQTITCEIGKRYQVTATGYLVSPAFNFIIGAAFGQGQEYDSGSTSQTKTFTLSFVAGRVSEVISLYNQGSGVVEWDNISVRELPGNHAYQSINTSRPTLRARYNLLTYSEEFDDAAWVKDGAGTTVTANQAVAPDGTFTADLATFTAGTGKRVRQNAAVISGQTYTFSMYARSVTGSVNARLFIAGVAVSGASQDVFALSTTWTRITFSPTFAASGTAQFRFDANDLDGSFYVWGAQLTATSVFPSNTYQRIGAATDYATGAAFPPYLFFDGTDDSMLTNSVDFATVTSDGQARRNLLTNPTQFDAAGWTPTNVTVTANSTTAPDGTTTADTITPDVTNATHNVATATVGSAVTTTYSIYAKANGYTFVNLRLEGTSNFFDIATGALGTVAVGSTCSIVSVGSGWYRCIVTRTIATPAGVAVRVATADLVDSFAGNGTSGVFLWGAQLETGSTATAFQNIGTDKMLVVAGVTKNSDAAVATLVELSASVSSGAFDLQAPSSITVANYRYRAGGTSIVSATTPSLYSAPITNVLTAQNDIGAPSISVRANGVQVVANTTSQGTGNFGNYPLYIGRRNNASLPLNGNIYSLVIAGAAYSAGQISSTESWVAAKTPLGTL